MSEPTPLQLIERTVLDQAKAIKLDLGDTEARARLRNLVDDAVAAWSTDFRRGLRSFDLADPELLAERSYRNLAGYGPLEPLLSDDDVWEIMVNAPDAIFVKRHQGRSGYHDESFHDDDHVTRTLTKILDDAAGAHRKLDPTEGLQDAQLDDGARVHIVHGDVGRGGHTMVNIRKFTGVAFRELEQLVDRDMLTVQAAEFLRVCARSKLTVLFAGAPGSGKTTILSCTAAELDPSLRIVVAEEVFEADVPLPNVASMQTRAARADRPAVDLRRLVAGFLRMAPDVAIVGEVRDKEALPLLLTLSSGVKGFTTIHAGSCRQALSRLRFISQLADTSSDIPMSALNSLVSESIDIVVHCAREANGPRVTEIIAVEDQAAGLDSTQFTVTDLFRRSRTGQPLQWTGQFPSRAGRAIEEAGHDLRCLLGMPDPRDPPRLGRPDLVGWRFRPSRRHRTAPVIGVLAPALAALGVYYLYTNVVYGWTGVALAPTLRRRPRRGPARQDWLVQAGLGEIRVRDFAAVMVLLFVIGTAVVFAVFGAIAPALAVGAFAASFPVASYRHRRTARRSRAQDAWPRLLEEIRILTASLGRSIPQALFEVGRRAPVEMQSAFDAAHREWLISTDFARTLTVLKAGLADPTADATCETLLVAHTVGGSDLDRRLEALIDDRIQDTQGRKDARAKQAGARFARRFVLFVPFGMALAGMSVGDGRAAFRSPTGQLLTLVAVIMVIVCWAWAGRILVVPEEERVFYE